MKLGTKSMGGQPVLFPNACFRSRPRPRSDYVLKALKRGQESFDDIWIFPRSRSELGSEAALNLWEFGTGRGGPRRRVAQNLLKCRSTALRLSARRVRLRRHGKVKLALLAVERT
jgi:hypothetical protein